MKKISLKNVKETLSRKEMRMISGTMYWNCRRQSSNLIDVRPGGCAFTYSYYDYITQCWISISC